MCACVWCCFGVKNRDLIGIFIWELAWLIFTIGLPEILKKKYDHPFVILEVVDVWLTRVLQARELFLFVRTNSIELCSVKGHCTVCSVFVLFVWYAFRVRSGEEYENKYLIGSSHILVWNMDNFELSNRLGLGVCFNCSLQPILLGCICLDLQVEGSRWFLFKKFNALVWAFYS